MYKASPGKPKLFETNGTPPRTHVPPLTLGDRIEIKDESGTVRFVGTTTFATGQWIGVELDNPVGKNDGSIQGQKYFDSLPNHGMFVRPSQVKLLSRVVNQTPITLDIDEKSLEENDPLQGSRCTSYHEAMSSPRKYPGSLRTSKPMQENRLGDNEKFSDIDQTNQENEHGVSQGHDLLVSMLDKSEIQLELTRKKLEDQICLNKNLQGLCDEQESLINGLYSQFQEFENKEIALQKQNRELIGEIEKLTFDLNKVSSEAHPNQVSFETNVLETSPIIPLNKRPIDETIEAQFGLSEEKINLRRRNEELNSELSSLREVLVENGKLRNKVSEIQDILEDLKERAEAADSAEEMIENLSSRKAFLESRVMELERSVQELEELRDIGREIDDMHLETERQLQNELIQYEDELESLKFQLTSERKIRQDLESQMIHLQNRLSQAQNVSKDNEGAHVEEGLSKSKLELVTQLTTTLSLDSLIDREKELIELEILQYRVGCLNKLASEATDSRFSNLLSSRCLIERAKRLCLAVSRMTFSYMNLTRDSYTILACFQLLILVTDVETLLEFMTLLFDSNNKSFLNTFFNHETSLDQLLIGFTKTLDRIKNFEFGATSDLKEIQDFLVYWSRLDVPWIYFEETPNCSNLIILKSARTTRQKFEILTSLDEKLSETENERGHESSFFFKFANEIESMSHDIVSGEIPEALSSLEQSINSCSNEHFALRKELIYKCVSRITEHVSQVCKFRLALTARMIEIHDRIGHVDDETKLKDWQTQMSRLMGFGDSETLEQAYMLTLKSILKNLVDLRLTIKQNSSFNEGTTGQDVWMMEISNVTHRLREYETISSELDKLQRSYNVLNQELLIRKQELDESTVREEHVKKRLEVMKKFSSPDGGSELELTKFRQQIKDYEESIHELQRELEVLESDNETLRKELKKFEQKDSLSNKRMTLASITESIRSPSSTASPNAKISLLSKNEIVHEQMDLVRLRHLIENLFIENRRLKLTKSQLDHDFMVEVQNYPSSCINSNKAMTIERLFMKNLLKSLEIPKLIPLKETSNVNLQKHELLEMRLNSIHTLGLLTTMKATLIRDIDVTSRFKSVNSPGCSILMGK